jgi:para-nitrobenzyl esterase
MFKFTRSKGTVMNKKVSVTILNKYKKLALSFLLLATLATTTACSGGGSSSPATNFDTPLTGVFVDAPVEGLNYQTETMSGITDGNGTFKYHVGETVTFMIGDLMLGSAAGSDIMTPIDLVPGAVDETDPTVTNICRLLQSLDWDGDLSNGIMITDTMRSEISGRMIDFTKDVSTFHDYDVQAFLDTMNMLGGFQNGENRGLMAPLDAQYNFQQTLMNHMDYMYSINPSWSPVHSGIGMNGISRMNQ